jgi:hypothetical protein
MKTTTAIKQVSLATAGAALLSLGGSIFAPSSAFAASVSFIEGANETDPIVVTTNLFLTAPIVTTPETATVTGFHYPAISPSPINRGSRAAGLFEPGSTTLLSDYVLFTAGPLTSNCPPVAGGICQNLSLNFFSVDTLVSDLPSGFTFGGGIEEDGTLQDISALLGTLPEGLIVRVQSQVAEPTPEPTSLLGFLALGVLGAGSACKRRGKEQAEN